MKREKKILDIYWALPNIQEKKVFILSRVTKVSPERTQKRVYNCSVKRRTRNNQYVHTFHSDSYNIHICQEIFLTTLSISKTLDQDQ